jgi:hypothetical protein
MENVATGMTAITEAATSVLTWLISAAQTIYEFLISNPLALLYIGISLAFVGFSVLRRVIHR